MNQIMMHKKMSNLNNQIKLNHLIKLNALQMQFRIAAQINKKMNLMIKTSQVS